MTDPRRPSLFQARDPLPHIHSRPRPHARSFPSSQAERHRLNVAQSQKRSGQQHSSPSRDLEDQAAPETRGRPRDVDDDISSILDHDLTAPLNNDILADALDDVPLASQVVSQVVSQVTKTDPLSQLVDSTVASTIPLVPAVATALVPTVPNPIVDLPDLPNLTAIESTLRGILTTALPLDISATITTSDPGSSPVPTASIPSTVFANVSTQAPTTLPTLTSSQAVLTPSAPPSWPRFPFSNGRNGTVTRTGTAESSRTQSILPSMPSIHNGTQHRLGGPPKNMTAIAHQGTGVPNAPRPPTSTFTAVSQATPSESLRSSAAMISGAALHTTFSTTHVADSTSHNAAPSTADHSDFRSVPSPTPMTAFDAPQPTASVSTTSSGGGGSGNLSPQQKQVIGGVIGGVAGVTLFAVLVMLLLKRRRRADGHGLSYLAHATATRGLLSGPRDGPDGPAPVSNPGGSGGAMMEREAPMGVAAALGGLIGRQGARPESSVSSGEKGFYRVSGKKLPSVLQVGGDGYTDPRESSNSNYNQNSNTASIIHNNNNNNNNNNNIHNNIVITTTAPTNNNNDNSNNNKNGATATTPSKSAGNNLDIYQALRSYDSMDEITSQIALGNPMRPISGIPIIRSGPVRTPVTITEGNPFDDRPGTPATDGTLPSPVSRDSPSGSRFLESIRFD